MTRCSSRTSFFRSRCPSPWCHPHRRLGRLRPRDRRRRRRLDSDCHRRRRLRRCRLRAWPSHRAPSPRSLCTAHWSEIRYQAGQLIAHGDFRSEQAIMSTPRSTDGHGREANLIKSARELAPNFGQGAKARALTLYQVTMCDRDHLAVRAEGKCTRLSREAIPSPLPRNSPKRDSP